MSGRGSATGLRGLPPMQEVPDDEKGIKKLLRATGTKGNYHPGLLCALKSSKNRRSPRKAYILLLGQTGAGKSSTINFLFENHEITKTGDTSSETSDILEFAASVPIPELGIKNSEIHVIDTPGLGDTRGIENDAKFIATLSNYLKNHDDLSKAVPNIVLIVGKFDDARLEGPSSGFNRMLKGVKLLEDQLIDKTFSNIIVVLTHYMNAKKELKNNPMPRYELIGRLLQDIGFPQPISVIGAENEAEERDLEEMNGYFKLPSGEYYPYNIFKRIQQITTENDPIGEAIIRTAFTNPALLQVNLFKEMKLLGGSQNPMYVKCMDELIGSQFSVQPTPISNKLAEVWENSLHPDLRKNYTGSLKIVQNIFQVRQIKEFNQLPKNPEDIIQFLKEIPQNEAILALLEKALGIIVPKLNIDYLIGKGYDILNDRSSSLIFQFNTFKTSPLGYKLPVGIKCELVNETEDICIFSESKQDYTTRRLTDLNLPTTEINQILGNVKSGYNVIQQMKANNNNEFTTLREHRIFQLTLEDPQFSQDFIKDIEKLPKFNDQQVHVKQIWKVFFDRYGTHVVSSAYGGGSIETYIQESHIKTLLEKVGGDFTQAMTNLSRLDRDLTASQATKDGEGIQAFGVKFRGGNMKYHKSNLSNIDPDEAASTLENWRTSLLTEPIMLETKLKLMPLSFHVRKRFSSIANEMEVACRALFDNSFNFIPIDKKDLPPPARFNIRRLGNGDDRSSCLKAGTMILTGDKTLKPIEYIKRGDYILDKDFKPSKVIGMNSFFLGNRNFYGFTPELQFFTEVHIFIDSNMKLSIVSKQAFLQENPVFELLENQINNLEKGIDFEIMKYSLEDETINPTICQLYEEDSSSYSKETPVYFLEVDNPSGTYFANGYLCRHELPPFNLWPNTFNFLQILLFECKVMTKIAQLQLNCNIYHQLSELVTEIALILNDGLQNGKFLNKSRSSEDFKEKSLSMVDESSLEFLLENQSLVAFGLLIYSKCGKILYNYLDKELNNYKDNTWSSRRINLGLVQGMLEDKVEQFVKQLEEANTTWIEE